MHAEELLTCIAESVASGELPDAASLEREVVLPGELTALSQSHMRLADTLYNIGRGHQRGKRGSLMRVKVNVFLRYHIKFTISIYS